MLFYHTGEIWKECAQKNKNFLILEDDIKINSNTSLDLIDSTNKIIEKVKENHLFVRLGNLFKRDFFELGEISTEVYTLCAIKISHPQQWDIYYPQYRKQTCTP